MKRFVLILVVLVLAGLAWWIMAQRSAPPEVTFATASIQKLVDTVVTNGKAEPIEWSAVRSERVGSIQRLTAEQGKEVGKGAEIAVLETAEARAELASAQAKVAQVQAEISVLKQGGRAVENTEIDSQLSRARADLKTAQTELATAERLIKQGAAPAHEAVVAREKIDSIKSQIESLEAKRKSLVMPADVSGAEARLRDAQTAVTLAERKIALSSIRTPIAGTVYDLPLRQGAFVSPGDIIANIGHLERMRVRVYVDEPELGRVGTGRPVNITWDSLPGKSWKGVVESMPSQVAALGSRQVGEVICIIENPGRELTPGANINATIESRSVDAALVIPKDTLRREADADGVYVLDNGKVRWQRLKLGVSSITSVQVLEGLKAGDRVALPTEKPLENGQPVRPVDAR